MNSEKSGRLEEEKSGSTKVISRSSSFTELNPKELLGKIKNVFVSHHVSWREFWVQVDTAKLDELDNLLNSKENVKLHGEQINNINPGDKCLVKLDGYWCRAQVIKEVDSAISVLCVDTGITSTVQLQDI